MTLCNFLHLLIAIDNHHYVIQVEDVLGPEHPYTKLVPNMVGIDPDDAFSTVPYEKGHTLLYYLETLVGGVGKY